MDLVKGDRIYVLVEYNLIPAEYLSTGKKNLKIKFQLSPWHLIETTYKSPDKIAQPNESIAIIWEVWKGVNGRGGYRIERKLYPHKRKPANKWAKQEWLYEKSYGVLQ